MRPGGALSMAGVSSRSDRVITRSLSASLRTLATLSSRMRAALKAAPSLWRSSSGEAIPA